jgi:hypothetical protein
MRRDATPATNAPTPDTVAPPDSPDATDGNCQPTIARKIAVANMPSAAPHAADASSAACPAATSEEAFAPGDDVVT